MTIIAMFIVRDVKKGEDGNFWVLSKKGLDDCIGDFRETILRKAKEDPSAFRHTDIYLESIYDLDRAEDSALFSFTVHAGDGRYSIYQPAAFGVDSYSWGRSEDEAGTEPFVRFVADTPRWTRLEEVQNQ